MNIVTIESTNANILRQKSKHIDFPLSSQIKQFINDMESFIKRLESPYGTPAGLAAPQVGHSLQIAFIQVSAEMIQRRNNVTQTIPLTALINPSYTPLLDTGMNKDWEGCYSVPEKMGEVWRYNAIEYQYYDREGKLIKNSASGFLARLIQHEIGHLNGELYIDLLQADCHFGTMDEMLEVRNQERCKNTE